MSGVDLGQAGKYPTVLDTRYRQLLGGLRRHSVSRSCHRNSRLSRTRSRVNAMSSMAYLVRPPSNETLRKALWPPSSRVASLISGRARAFARSACDWSTPTNVASGNEPSALREDCQFRNARRYIAPYALDADEIEDQGRQGSAPSTHIGIVAVGVPILQSVRHDSPTGNSGLGRRHDTEGSVARLAATAVRPPHER